MQEQRLDVHTTIMVTPNDAILGCTRRIQINEDAPIDVKIPPGSRSGQKLLLRGKGNFQPSTGRRGDLYLEIKVQEKEVYTREKVNTRNQTTSHWKHKRCEMTLGAASIAILAFIAANPAYTVGAFDSLLAASSNITSGISRMMSQTKTAIPLIQAPTRILALNLVQGGTGFGSLEGQIRGCLRRKDSVRSSEVRSFIAKGGRLISTGETYTKNYYDSVRSFDCYYSTITVEGNSDQLRLLRQ